MAYERMCPRYEKTMELLGKRWTGLILRILMGGPKRFGAFREQVPEISDRILSDRLTELEEVGIILRHVHQTKPVLIEYELTEKGQELKQVVDSVQEWAERWVET